MNLKWLFSIITIAAIIGAVAYENTSTRLVPEVLHGRWVTDEPRYRNCYINLTEDFVEIGAGVGVSNFGVVTTVTTEIRKDYVYYVVTYYDAKGLESTLSLHYTPSPGEMLRLGNQKKVLWLKMNEDGL